MEEIDTTGKEYVGNTYSSGLYYINTYLGGGKRREIIVPKWLFYLIWFSWFLTKPHYRKLKNANVLIEEECPPNEF